MNNFEEASYIDMVSSLRTTDLQVLMRTFTGSISDRKYELMEQALNLLRNNPPGFNINAYLAKITDIYQRMVRETTNNNDMMRNSSHSQQQNIQVATHQQHQQTTYQPTQYNHQIMIRAGLPQIQRRNNCMPHNQQTGSRRMITQNPNRTQSGLVRSTTESTATLNNSLTPTDQSLICVKLKKLPFFKVEGDVMKPVIITGHEKITLPMSGRVKKEASFKIVLSPHHCNLVVMHRDMSNKEHEYMYQIQIRICELKQGCTEISDHMPFGIQIRLNNNLCTLPPFPPKNLQGTVPRRIPQPIDCTEFMKLCPIVANQMILNWNPDGKTYVVSMHLVKRLTSDMLLKELQEKEPRSSEETKNYIIKKLTDVDPDLATTNYRVSLLCPLSKMRMKVPAKSIKCEHLQSFDAISFLQMNEKKPTWTCPTCNNPCLFDDIKIENYFLEVVSSSKITNDTKEIELLADGTWKVYKEMEECESTSDDKEKPMDSIILDDTDDSNDYPKNNLKSLNSQDSENINSFFIDLTLSDGDAESPKEAEKQENEAQASNAVQSTTGVSLKPEAQVQPQQADSSSEQEVILIDSPSPHSSSTPTTSAS